VLLAAAALAPVAAAGTYGHTPKPPPRQVVVRTELVPASDGFDWLDAAAGFGLAIVSMAIVLLVVVAHERASVAQRLNGKDA
jgi:hypothetical protein